MVFKTLDSFSKGQKCQLCLTTKVDPEALGSICQTADVIVHYFCLLLASKIQQKGTDKQGLLGFFSRDIKKEIKRGSTIVCNYCRKYGATVMCGKDNCHLNFHVPCAQRKGSLHQYFNEFKSFCDKHKPRQKIPATLKKRTDLECVLCCSHIKFNVKSYEDDPIWPTCCKPQALLHKRCLQHFATCSGYYFKCPFCSNKDDFHKGMKTYGIYIPEQEASWETEPDAYRELLERDVTCDAVRCRCPRGRVYSVRNSKWYLEVCILCGASGRHRGCLLEDILTDTYECDVCSKVNKKYPIPSEDTPEPSPLSDKVECNETVQQTVEGNISKNLSLECEEIVVISDSESEDNDVEVIGIIPPPTVTKNVRKRQLPVQHDKRYGVKRQRLAESGAETSSEMCLTIDEERRSPLMQAMDNPSFRTDEVANNSQTREMDFPNRESSICTLSELNQTELAQLPPESFNTNEENSSHSRIQCIDLLSDNETDQVLVISDTDSESIASSLLDSDGSLLDLSEIPESEKSLLLENFSPPNHYSKDFFPRKTQTPKKRRKKKKRVVQKKKNTSVKTPPSLKHNLNTQSGETCNDKKINAPSDQKKRNLESTSSSEVVNTNIPSSSLEENCNLSEDESFRGFCCEETQSNNEAVKICTLLVDESIQKNKTGSIDGKVIDSAQHMSDNDVSLPSVDDTSKCITLDNLNLINEIKNLECQVTDLSENIPPKSADYDAIKSISDSVVLKVLTKDDSNCNNSILNDSESSKCKNNKFTEATVTSLEEVCPNKISIDAVTSSSNPSELSGNIQNISESKIDSDIDEVMAISHQTVNDENIISNVLTKEYTSEEGSIETLNTKNQPVIPAISKSDKAECAYKTNKREYKNNKPKILCSLALKQPFGQISDLLCNLKGAHPKNKLHLNKCNEICSESKIFPIGDNDSEINLGLQFASTETSSNEVDLKILDIPTNQFFNVSYDTIEDSRSPKKSGFQAELHSPKMFAHVSQEANSSGNNTEAGRKLRPAITIDNLPMRPQSFERVSHSDVLVSKSTSERQVGLERNIKEVPLNLHSLKNIESPIAYSSNLEIQMESKNSSQSEMKKMSSKRISKFPKKSDSSKLNSDFSNFLQEEENLKSIKISVKKNPDVFNLAETTHEVDVESPAPALAFIEHSEPHQNSLSEKHSLINKSRTKIELKNSESNLDIQMESIISSESEPKSVSSKLNLKSSLPEGEASLIEKKLDALQIHVSSPDHELQSCKLEPTKSLEGSKPPELTPNLEKCKPHKSRGRKGKSKVQSRKKISVQIKPSKISSCEIAHTSKHIKEKELQTEVKHEVKVDLQPPEVSYSQVHMVLPPSEPNQSHEASVSETHEFYDDSVAHIKSNVCTKPEDLLVMNSSVKVSKIHSQIETKYSCDDSQIYPPLGEKLGECSKSLVQANEQGKLKTILMAADENKLSIEIENNFKQIDDSITLNGENNVVPLEDFGKKMSIDDSKVHSNLESKYVSDNSPLDESFTNQLPSNKGGKLKATLTEAEKNKVTVEIENNFMEIDDSISFYSNLCFRNQDHENIENEMDENKGNCVSRDNEIKKHDWYKICKTDCSTCHNSIELTSKHNIMMNDSIDVCFYCKDKIDNTSFDQSCSQVSSTCSCQGKKSKFSVNDSSVKRHHEDMRFEVFNDSKLSLGCSLTGSDLNSNYKSNKALEEKKSFEDGSLKIVSEEVENSSSNISDVSPPERRNTPTDLVQNPIQAIPNFIENSLDLSEAAKSDVQIIPEKKDPKIELVANMNDESTETPNESSIRQFCDEVSDDNDDERTYKSKRYSNEIFRVRIILKKVIGDDDRPSIMSHAEYFWVHNRKRLRQVLKTRYFSENDEQLVIYTDVCGFRYARLFTENIPEKINPRVVFETGGDMSYYLQKVIKYHETEKVNSRRTVLIIYGNALLPNKNVFDLLQSASNLDKIKLIVTTVTSQKPRTLKFNRKLLYYSKKFGYNIWDITKIHFLNDINT
ncbi:uncharacterized protein [Halyomorpha halys]|uniref:uncharacterized protein isoform X2 n=2 Tax=Halyomorpha halys TaxID=286706 RepID=UPI0034D166B7